MSEAHTPGPWHIRYGNISDADEGFGIATKNEADPRLVCECWPCTTTLEHRQQMRADARLIAAAPDLLAACVAAEIELDIWANSMGGGDTAFAALATVRAAIQLAKGETK